jgi:hypothetical protein
MDPEFGDRLIALSRRLHVWIVATPANQAVAERIWRADGGGSSLERGVTTFPSDPGVPRDELASRYLDTIEDHHGPYSHTPPWTVLEVFGAPPTAELSAALGDLGFSRVEPTSDGFVATRTEADAR